MIKPQGFAVEDICHQHFACRNNGAELESLESGDGCSYGRGQSTLAIVIEKQNPLQNSSCQGRSLWNKYLDLYMPLYASSSQSPADVTPPLH